MKSGSSLNPAPAQQAAYKGRLMSTRSTASRDSSAVIRNRFPHDTASGSVGASSEALIPIASAKRARSPIVPAYSGFFCVIQAKSSASAFQSSETGVGPTPRPNTNARCPLAITPS